MTSLQEDNLIQWIKEQKELLNLELEEEGHQLKDRIFSLSAKVCEVEGLSLLSLEVVAISNALFGRSAITLQKTGKVPLPSGFKVGDEVSLYNSHRNKNKKKNKNEKNGVRKEGEDEEEDDEVEVYGVVRKISQYTIEIIVDEVEEGLGGQGLRLDKRSSEKTHEKMMQALDQLAGKKASTHPLVPLLFSSSTVRDDLSYLVPPKENLQAMEWYNQNLNLSQQEAIALCLDSPLLGIIHGPPGTGKTSTLIEVILQAMRRNQRILICAPSNIAVDTILLRLTHSLAHNRCLGKGEVNGVLRLGHIARVMEAVLPYTLDYQIDHDDGTEIVKDVRHELESLRATLFSRKMDKGKGSTGRKVASELEGRSRKEMKVELKEARKEVVRREKEVVRRILSHSQVVLSTCVGAASSLLNDMEFDLVVVDEAAQGLEAACWIPILRGKKVILAGDHCQLPPTVKSPVAARRGLSRTLFERIIQDSRFASLCCLLNVQYRMNDQISQWASREMYEGAVTSAPAVAEHSLQDYLYDDCAPSSSSTNLSIQEQFSVLLMIDTSGCLMFEGEEDGGGKVSHSNQNEAQIVLLHVLHLISFGVKPSDIGVITPYNGQLEVLRGLFHQIDCVKMRQACPSSKAWQTVDSLEGLEIKTIDGFQGGEKECIIISLVRSNPRREVGFLGDNRRINVAVTRAKRHLALICDSETCSTNNFIKTLVDHVEEHGLVIGAEDFLAEQMQEEAGHLIMSSITAKRSLPVTTSAKSNPIQSKQAKTTTTSTSSKSPSTSATTNSRPVSAAKIPPHETLPKIQEDSEFRIKTDEMLSNLKTLSLSIIDEMELVAKLPPHAVFYWKRKDDGSYVGMVSFSFPAQLTSFQRRVVHEIAEKYALEHISIGEGEGRQIEVSLCCPQFKHPGQGTAMNAINKSLAQGQEPLVEPEGEGVEEQDDEEDEEDDNGESAATLQSQPKEGLDQVTSTTSNNSKNNKKNKKQKKKQQPSEPSNGPTRSNKSSAVEAITADLDEDMILELAIAENQRKADLEKYRLKGTRAMPNYERENAKEKLRSKLAESQAARRPTQPEKADGKQDQSSSRPGSQQAKKPVPNFGGGRLGTK